MRKIILHPLVKSKSGGEWQLYRVEQYALYASDGMKEVYMFKGFENRLVKATEVASPEFMAYFDETFDEAIIEGLPKTLTVYVSEELPQQPIQKNWLTRLLKL